MTYFIVTESFASGLNAQDLSSLLARHLRTAMPDLKTDQIVQFPMVDGGDGMVETLVTLLLGSFLEVDATSASGGQLVVPLGFIGENNNIALLRLGSICGPEGTEFQSDALVSGTTFGVGELIQDALDEGAFSVVLGLDEPIARDAGLGLAAALGVKFFDKNDTLLDLSKPRADLFDVIAKIDATARPFELLSARLFVARARTASHGEPDERLIAALNKLNMIVEHDCGKAVDLAHVQPSGSGIEFGLHAFFTTEFHEGSALILQASGIEQKMKEIAEPQMLIAAESLDNIIGENALDAMSKLVSLADEKNIPLTFIVNTATSESKVTQIKKQLKSFQGVFSLPEAPLFQAPLGPNAGEEEIRRDQKMRIEKLVPKLFPNGQPQSNGFESASVKHKNGSKTPRPS